MCPRFPEFLGFKPLNYATLIQSTAISHLDILVVSSHPISPCYILCTLNSGVRLIFLNRSLSLSSKSSNQTPSLRILKSLKWSTSLSYPLRVGCSAKDSACNAEDTGHVDSTRGAGRSPGGRNGNRLQYSCLGNPMEGGAWWATVHGVTNVRHD